MAYSDKAELLGNLSVKLGDAVTANELSKLMEAISTELESYELTRTVTES